MKRLLALAFVLAIFVALAADEVSLGQTPYIAGEYVPGEVLIIERPGARAQNVASVLAGAQEIERLPGLGVHRIKLPPQASVEDAVRRLHALHWVEAAEPNYIVRASIEPNDPVYSSDPGQRWYYRLLDAPAAWDIETGSRDVTVAVIDSGIDLDHPDLDGNLWLNSRDPIDGVDNDGNTIVDDYYGAAFISSASSGCSTPAANNPNDDSGHGTQVAGVIGAETNNSQGVSGVAWRVSLTAVKALDCNNTGTTLDAAKAVDYAAAQGARIINMSFSISVRDSNGNCVSPAAPNTLGAAVKQAHESYGAVLVGSTGNDNCQYVAYPAAFPEVIAVGASGGQSSPDKRAACPSPCFSNWGPEVDVAAPGVNICSTHWSSGSGATYACNLAGTSYSAPLVSGLAALLLSKSSLLTAAEVRTMIKAAAKNLPDDGATNWDGAGRINMKGSLDQIQHRSFIPGIRVD